MVSHTDRVHRSRNAFAGQRGPRVLLIGYNGANNTGAEALLLSDIEDIRASLGPDARLTIPSLDVSNLRRYLKESNSLRIVKMPTLFPLEVWRQVRRSDIVLLVEGSAYMDSWTSALLWYFLWATRCAHMLGKPCLAYAVDAGQLRPANQRLVRREASLTDLIVTRSRAAAERLRGWGVTAPIEVTADNAFNFTPRREDQDLLARLWPEASEVVGLAVVDFHLWPVVMRPWGKREDCYKWPYYYSRSPERTRATAQLAEDYAAIADRLAEQGRQVALIGMEQLDEPLARQVQAKMAHTEKARVFSSREYNASQMTSILRGLRALVTSRYHAGVLSLAAQVPQMAVGHDLRLRTLYQELGLLEEYFVEPDAPDLREAIWSRLQRLIEAPDTVRQSLRRGYEEHLTDARRNPELLRAFLRAHGWEGAIGRHSVAYGSDRLPGLTDLPAAS